MRIVVGAVVACSSLVWLLAGRYLGRRRWRVLPVLLVLPALTFTLNELRWWHFEQGLAEATAPLLHRRDAGFGCERLMRGFFSSQGRAGHVWFDADGRPAERAFLSSSTCSRVKGYQDDPRGASMDEVSAVHIVVHEAAHLSGVRPEAEAECTALQSDVATMVALGAPEAVARAQVGSYLALVYPRLDDSYVSSDCAADGALDHSPGDGSWP